MLLTTLINIPVILGILIISALAILRRTVPGLRYFAITSICIAVWLGLQYIAQIVHEPTMELFCVRLAVGVAGLLVFFLVLFIKEYTSSRSPVKLSSFVKIVAVALPILLFGLSLTDLSIRSVAVNDVGISAQSGPLFGLQLVILAVYSVFGLVLLISDTVKAKSSNRTKNYLLILALSQAIIINFVASIFYTSSTVSQIAAPGSLFILTLLVMYAIIKHRLFDVRLIVARSIGYVLSVVAVGFLFGVVAFFVFNKLLFSSNNLSMVQEFGFAATAVAMSLTFQPIKRFFDRTTNRIFFQDSYDPQVLLDELNKALVATIDLNSLLSQVKNLFERHLKVDYCMFGLHEYGATKQRVIGFMPEQMTDNDLVRMRKITSMIGERVIVTDYLDEEHAELKEILQRYSIAVLARLALATEIHKEGVGYLILGPKKSGNPYTKQDIKTVDIITNELVIAIQNAMRFEEIQNFNKVLQEKIDKATKELRRTNEKLKALDEAKDDFISMASHQLRTPLTSVKGYLSMVLEGDTGKITDTQRQLLDQAFVSSQRMVFLIADLLNVSRLKTGKFIIESAPTNLANVIDEEVSQLQETAKSRGLELHYNKPANFPTLMIDETKIRQVIMNFIDNAVYYTPAGGHIDIRLTNQKESIQVEVADDGIGVPKTEQHHLFSKFYRARNARKARPDGTGLGLFMAKKVIVAQGGTLIFHSSEGKGSTFGFIFPKQKLTLPKTAKPVLTSQAK